MIKYTDIVKAAPFARIIQVTSKGVSYALTGQVDAVEKDLYTLLIPAVKIADDLKLQPTEKTIYLSRFIREGLAVGDVVSLTGEDLSMSLK